MTVPTHRKPVVVATVGARHGPFDLALEHGALVRQLGALQRRVGEQLRAQSETMSALQDENMRLRAGLLVLRTALFWGLAAVHAGALGRVPARISGARVRAPWPEAQAVICQTACAGHAHPWRGDDGQCQRTGLACGTGASAPRERET